MLQSGETDKQELTSHPVIGRIVELRKLIAASAKTDVTLGKEIENLLQVSWASRDTQHHIWPSRDAQHLLPR